MSKSNKLIIKLAHTTLLTTLLIASGYSYANTDANANKWFPNAKPIVNLQPFAGVGLGVPFYGVGDYGDDRTNKLFNKHTAFGNVGYNATLGLSIMQYLAVVAQYNNFGEATDTVGSKLSANDVVLAARGILPFNNIFPVKTDVSLFIDMGLASLSYNIDASNTSGFSSVSGSTAAAAYDFGAAYQFAPNMQVSTEYHSVVTSNMNSENFVADMIEANLTVYF